MSLPFELSYLRGAWRAYWKPHEVRVVVAGTEAGPEPGNLAAMCDVIARWNEVKQAVSEFAAGLAADDHVPLEPNSLGGFAAKSCGFDQELAFFAVLAEDPAAPDHVDLRFDTGLPDGYAAYRVAVVGGVPKSITAFAT